MGQTESQSNIQQQYDIVKLREDGTALLHHKRTQDQFMLRTVSSNIHQEIVLFQDMLKKRQHVRSSHLLDLVQIRRKQQKNVCSVVHKLYLLIEFPFKTLKDEMMDKICHTKVVPFLQAQLWSILYSCCQGLNSLYCKKMPHQSLTSNQIYISREGIIKIADPILLGLQKNYIKVLKNSDQHVQISPEILNFLDDCNFSFYDKQKSDVFILGVIMLEASLLRPIQLFDQKTKKPYLQIINSGLKQVREKYSQSYCNLIQMMLQLHSKLRPRFQDLITLIEHDTNLYESTDEASVQHRTQTSQQFINSKNYKSQKTLPRPCHVKNQGIQNSVSSKNRTMNRSDSANNMHSIKPYVQHGQYETIIKMLQTENIVKANNDNRTYIPPPGFQPVTYPIPSQINQSALQQSKQHPYIHNLGHQQAHNIPQMHRFNNMQQVHNNFNQNNPTAFYQHPNKQQSNSQPISPQPVNSQPPSARFLDVNQRFSYTKFGNITLPNQPPNQQLNTQPSVQPNHKPIYSYQIPQINQLLKNCKVNSSFATTLPKSKNFLNNLQSNEMNLEPMRKQPSPKQIASNEGTVISLKRINQEKQKKIPIINHDNKNQMVENAELDRIEIISSWTDQSNLVDLKNKQVKVASQTGYQISNGPRISLNGLLKQNSGKKNEIYAVTQKTEENMDTSPGRTNFKVQSALKLNQPQRSPGYQNSRIASSSKQQSQTNLQNEPKYVVLILDGGGRYEGFLKNGMKNGDGKLQFNDGGYYVGQWKDNKMHGVGKLHYQNGQIAYEGDWDNDQFCGFGRVFNDRPEKLIGQFNYYDFADLGQKWIYYQGEFKNDSKHGKGKIRLTNGQVFEGNFVFDSIEGEGIFYTSRGQAIKGCWRDNMLIQS